VIESMNIRARIGKGESMREREGHVGPMY
jgi:hypothetical protein